ncbi:hypothetical protein BD311DRAFT_745293 [Dichomitus squalens]|uniref:Uncharacterized protein n=1 Tax=Dichomitus squalens TaxID=114155 RepID=A0A4Q9N320_9APHY|nr:hypothetical protein BD311DRAFT_745293 [Dichomitus squalens]
MLLDNSPSSLLRVSNRILGVVTAGSRKVLEGWDRGASTTIGATMMPSQRRGTSHGLSKELEEAVAIVSAGRRGRLDKGSHRPNSVAPEVLEEIRQGPWRTIWSATALFSASGGRPVYVLVELPSNVKGVRFRKKDEEMIPCLPSEHPRQSLMRDFGS